MPDTTLQNFVLKFLPDLTADTAKVLWWCMRSAFLYFEGGDLCRGGDKGNSEQIAMAIAMRFGKPFFSWMEGYNQVANSGKYPTLKFEMGPVGWIIAKPKDWVKPEPAKGEEPQPEYEVIADPTKDWSQAPWFMFPDPQGGLPWESPVKKPEELREFERQRNLAIQEAEELTLSHPYNSLMFMSVKRPAENELTRMSGRLTSICSKVGARWGNNLGMIGVQRED